MPACRSQCACGPRDDHALALRRRDCALRNLYGLGCEEASYVVGGKGRRTTGTIGPPCQGEHMRGEVVNSFKIGAGHTPHQPGEILNCVVAAGRTPGTMGAGSSKADSRQATTGSQATITSRPTMRVAILA